MIIDIAIEHETRISLAAIQNGLPAIRKLTLTNPSTHHVDDIEVEICLDPQLAPPKRVRIKRIWSNSVHVIEDLSIDISPASMQTLTEAIKGHLRIRVSTIAEPAQDETPSVPRELGFALADVEWLPANEWPGAASLPELLAAFVAPNSPSLRELLVKTQELMREKFQGDDSLDGYQSGDSQRVANVVQSLYETLQAYGLSYITPPASFEKNGQKVRSHGDVLTTQQGSCLDFTLLFGALMEQCGLNPVLVLVKGHAFPGVWVTDFHLPCPSLDDPLPLRKRVALDEALVFESTLLTSGGTFLDARQKASDRLNDTDNFQLFVDVKAARQDGIRPLWTMSGPDIGPGVEPHVRGSTTDTAQPSLSLESPVDVEPTSAEFLRNKITRWKGKLLDTSLRNRLLNFKEGKRAVRVRFADLASLEDELAANVSFKLMDRRPPTPGPQGGPPTPLDLANTLAQEREFLAAAQDRHELFTDLTPKETKKRLTDLFRLSRTSIEETGAHTMYLAMGCLRWRPKQSPNEDRISPLLLMPVQIKRGRGDIPFEIIATDEGTQSNVTLLKVLNDEFGLSDQALDVLPEDDSGIDVDQILRRFKQLVLHQEGWEVLEDCWLAPFTFSKFLMWRDIDATEDLVLANEVVRHICQGGGEPYPLEAPFLADDELDEKVPLGKVPLVCDADPSQLSTIMAVRAGSSFVLQGPPGTGKSQTITNIIANTVFEGKTVLFVSEKMAALEVVKRRLDNAGLGEFCLELHSNKANKRAVIKQLQEASEAGRHRATVDCARLVQDLTATQTSLNQYAALLRKQSSFGPTAFQIVSRLIGLQDAPVVDIDLGQWSEGSLSETRFAELNDAVRALEIAGKTVPQPGEHPWRRCARTLWRDRWKNNVITSIDQVLAAQADLELYLANQPDVLGFDASEANRDQLEAVSVLLEELLSTPVPPVSLLSSGVWQTIRKPIDEWLGKGLQRERLWSGDASTSEDNTAVTLSARDSKGLKARYTSDVLSLELAVLKRRLERWLGSNAVVRFFMLWSARRALKRVCLNRKLSADHQLLADIQAAIVVVTNDHYLTKASAKATQVLGARFWRGTDSEWSALAQMLDWVGRFRALLDRVYVGDSMDSARARMQRWATEESDQLAEGRPRHIELKDIQKATAKLLVKLSDLETLLLVERLGEADETESGKKVFTGALNEEMRGLEAMRAAPEKLRHWCVWKRVATDARRQGLGGLVDAWLGGCALDAQHRVFPGQLREAYERAVFDWWWNGYIESEPSLALTGDERDEMVRRFRDQDREWLQMSRRLVRAKVVSKLPHPDAPGDMAVLRRQFQLKTRHMPIRRLFMDMPGLIQSLKPCVLMSPLSVAKYLAPGSESAFDLVIFDEASQIPPWDAIGAIARSKKQVVIVGDSKQLPPTSFFNRVVAEDDDDDELSHPWDIADVESILEEATASGITAKSLRWHYRSRHESLIAFSNHHYYNGELNIFPSVSHDASSLGVKFWPVANTFYDRGKSTTNRGEALKIADEIVRRLRDPQLQRKSIGVVTFNSHQQGLIEDLLDQARLKYPEIDKYFTSQVKEPVFVKNLENVQGDERDVMLFSICYGPDRAGKVTMYFGPLNNKGGERRLNVAVTRAKELMIVVSSLGHEQIDLSRSNALGVRHFKSFLQYAKIGIGALNAEVSRNPLADVESPFEADVKKWLEDEGYEVHAQVGCSGYRIDLGIVHPERPGEYVLGVECDGATYHSSANARSRDRQRQEVLEGLRWTIHRIWSTEWFYGRAEEMAKLRHAIEDALQSEPETTGSTNVPVETPIEPELDAPVVVSADLLPVGSNEIMCAPNQRPYAFIEAREWGGRDAFFESRTRREIRKCLLEIIDLEGPVEMARADRLVVRSWGYSSLGTQLRLAVHRQVGRLEGDGKVRRIAGYYWPTSIDIEQWEVFRIAGAARESVRKATEVPPEEAANAGWWVLYQAKSITRSDLIGEIGRLMGFSRIGPNVRSMASAGVDILVQSGRAHHTGSRLQWVDRSSPFAD